MCTATFKSKDKRDAAKPDTEQQCPVEYWQHAFILHSYPKWLTSEKKSNTSI